MKNPYDSKEELYFSWWLKELVNQGYVKYFIHEPKPFHLSASINKTYLKQLKTREKVESEELLKGHIYTPDFMVVWHESAEELFTELIDSNNKKKQGQALNTIISQEDEEGAVVSYIEIKPSFDQNNMTRLAKLNQKWVYEKFDVFVNIIIPEKHFNKSFTPERYFLTDNSMQPRKMKHKNIQRIEDFIKKKTFFK